MLEQAQNPLNPYCQDWLEKIECAKKSKWERFGQYAEEAMRFFDGPHDWMWKDGYATGAGGFLEKSAQKPNFRMTVNRVFEAVALYGPALYHQNPNVLVTPSPKPDFSPESVGIDVTDMIGAQVYETLRQEMETQLRIKQTQADYMSHYGNWLMVEGNQKYQSRRAITEAVVKGMGTLWVEMFSAPGSEVQYPQAVYDSVDNLVVDPDATCWEDVQWIARRCVHPVNKVEEKYGLPPKSLKGTLQSANSQSTTAGRRAARNKKTVGESFDLLEYWQIYSKNGFGGRLKTLDSAGREVPDMEWVGDFCYIVVAKSVPYPLNIPSSVFVDPEIEDQDIADMAQWPIPFWKDPKCDGGWPMTRLYFYDKPGSIWPISLIKPAIGEIRFVNWCFSFLADKTAASCSTYLGMAKSAAVKIKDQLEKSGAGLGSMPYIILEIDALIEASGKLSNVVDFLNPPEFNESIWKMLSAVLDLIDRRTGITPLLAGIRGDSQMRSAKEADVMDQNSQIRPEDMTMRTEDWLSQTSAKQLFAADWLLEGKDVEPVVGMIGARVWDIRRAQDDPDSISRDFQFRIEAGSARKPNKTNRIRTLNEFSQFALPVLGQLAMEGMPGPWNAFLHDWAKANDFDTDPYMVQPPDQMGPTPEQIEAESKVQELELKRAEKGMDMRFSAQKHRQELRQDQEKHKIELKQVKEKAKVDTSIAKQRLSVQKQQARLRASSNGSKK